ncbi:ABC transporter permease [Sneathiella chinensis]|uniref:ABC transporter permease n=1 Tax=Sneathiella chinensis TaxID=349750 RepID=A0ABQ5U7X6_9PROT|nr:ABC transporter permease [Sneathiella chinensis]GLQ07374.1 ABC transporter permease [Sneathiella chinensis]
MINFILKRLLQSTVVMLFVALISFFLFNFVGDPISNMVGQETSTEDMEQLRENLGLNDPFLVQFARFVGNAVQGDFGISYRLQRPVEELVAERMPATLELVFVSALIAIGLGVAGGLFTGLRKNHWLARLTLTSSLIGVSLPTFIIGILLIYIFAVQLNWLPSFGRGEVVQITDGWSTGLLTGSGWRAIILPAITLALYQTTLILRIIRSEMLEVMRTDFIKFAKARGLKSRDINYGHALKNTLIPVITVTGLQIGSLIAFSIITETVFQWPGMGNLFIQAVQFADVPVMSAYLVLVALFFVVINLIVDLLYFVVDPRLRADLVH